DLFRSAQAFGDVQFGETGLHKGGFKLSVDTSCGRISVGILASPPIVLNGRMQGLGAIRYEMTKPTCVEDGCRFCVVSGRPGDLRSPVFPKSCLQPSVHFHDDVGLQADVVWKLLLRSLLLFIR